MKMKIIRIAFIVFVIGFSLSAVAQYPDIPKDVQAWSDSLMKAATKHSDAAWAKAYPIIKEEAKHGRPDIPRASRPIDLPQADIPAFPGAEGGGKYVFGGRGGRVIVV